MLKIIEIEIENNKKLKVFHKTLNGNNMHIAGPTGSGKTTAVTALWNVLQKGSDQIRHGEDRAKIKVALADGSRKLVCTRVYAPNSSRITIVDEHNAPIEVSHVQKMLSDLSVDPHKIVSLKPTERLQVLLRAAGVEDKLNELNSKIAGAENERLIAKRMLSEPGAAPVEVQPADLGALLEKQRVIQEHNKNVIRRETIKRAQEDKARFAASKVADLEAALAKAKTEHEASERILASMQSIPEKQDEAEITAELAAVQDTNKKAAVYAEWKRRKDKYDADYLKWNMHDNDVRELQTARKELLDTVKFPMKELAIKEGQIYYKGILFENLGESETQLVCAALVSKSIKDIGVVRLDGVESMSPGDFEALCGIFNDADIQVLSTRVSRNGDISPEEVVIVDGEYKD